MLTNEIKEFIQEMLKTGTIVEEQIRKHTGASNQSTVNKGCHEQTLICKTLLENQGYLEHRDRLLCLFRTFRLTTVVLRSAFV